MTDAISRSWIWTNIMMLPHNGDMISSEEVEEEINTAPALDVAPVVHARWDKVEREAFWIGDQDEWMRTGKPTKRVMPVCSHCKTEFGTAAFEYKYCPFCGARTDGEIDA